MSRKRETTTGPACRHCERVIRRTRWGFVHDVGESVYCHPEIPGSRFAEPK